MSIIPLKIIVNHILFESDAGFCGFLVRVRAARTIGLIRDGKNLTPPPGASHQTYLFKLFSFKNIFKKHFITWTQRHGRGRLTWKMRHRRCRNYHKIQSLSCFSSGRSDRVKLPFVRRRIRFPKGFKQLIIISSLTFHLFYYLLI